MSATTKTALRASARAARAALSPVERNEASAQVVARLERMPELRRARTVVLYAATRDEADPGGLLPHLLRRGVRTLFPRVRGEHLELVAASDLAALQLGYRGITEPVGPAVDPEVVDVVLVPGVAFDPAGGRLGQGGGHYDRLLGRLPRHATRIGVCFSCQVVPRVPREAHDVAVDVVVTERVTHRVDARR
ncbi:5-formyltetrahydrofolate cyclo-ligase [Egicoccus sp. AB-alg2]|uniref:5-formyltetrahydrofolate cyclo-ligase n=1 Tax=Egicoccus sp. AB-alg2 TaxID=3242693 RepID=UPI00359CCC71